MKEKTITIADSIGFFEVSDEHTAEQMRNTYESTHGPNEGTTAVIYGPIINEEGELFWGVDVLVERAYGHKNLNEITRK